MAIDISKVFEASPSVRVELFAPTNTVKIRFARDIDPDIYCLNDIRVTAAILKLGLAGELIDPNTGKKLRLSPLEESWKGGKA